MQDILDVIKNVENIYDSDTSTVLKDFERVLDELDLYVYKNWEDGELVSVPNIKRHWIICSFMWPKRKDARSHGREEITRLRLQSNVQKRQHN